MLGGTKASVGVRVGRFELDAGALMSSSIMTGALGFGFWALSARTASADDVGRAAAVISTATMLATVANLSVGNLYVRFLPVAGRDARRLVAAGMIVTVSLAGVLGLGLLVVGPRDRLFDSDLGVVLFPVCTMVLAAFALQDPILVGLRRARLVALKNTVQSVLKLVLLGGAALLVASSTTIVAAWMVPAAVVTAVVAWFGVRPAVAAKTEPSNLPSRRQLMGFFGGTYAMTLAGVAVPLTVPLLIVASLGTAANAYFNVCWLMASTLGILIATSREPYIAEAATAGTDLRDTTTRYIRLCLGAGVAGGLILATAGPVALLIMGRDYADAATRLVWLMALTMPLLAVITLYGALAQHFRRLRLAGSVQFITAALIIAGIALTAPRWGLTSVGFVYLTVDLLAVTIISVPLYRFLRSIYHRASVPGRAVGEPRAGVGQLSDGVGAQP
jgi:O-antigen/teichoic acid export membrane protein